MALKRFEVIEHTADIGLRVWGENPQQLFVHAAQGMFSIIAKKKSKDCGTTTEFNIDICANNREELLVGWLSELLTLADIHSLFFIHFQIHKLTKTNIKATAAAEKVSQRKHTLQAQIKAVTYHQLKILKKGQQLIAAMIFDT